VHFLFIRSPCGITVSLCHLALSFRQWSRFAGLPLAMINNNGPEYFWAICIASVTCSLGNGVHQLCVHLCHSSDPAPLSPPGSHSLMSWAGGERGGFVNYLMLFMAACVALDGRCCHCHFDTLLLCHFATCQMANGTSSCCDNNCLAGGPFRDLCDWCCCWCDGCQQKLFPFDCSWVPCWPAGNPS